jgi:hypothetical protein
MPSLDTNLLADLVRAKHTCLVQLRDMGRRQLELVDEGNMTALLDVLSAKQRPLVELQRIEKALDPFRSQDPQQRCWRTAEDRAACADCLRQCDDLLAEIVGQEKRSEAALARRRQETAIQLSGVHLAGQALGAYAAPPRHESTHIDLVAGT